MCSYIRILRWGRLTGVLALPEASTCAGQETRPTLGKMKGEGEESARG